MGHNRPRDIVTSSLNREWENRGRQTGERRFGLEADQVNGDLGEDLLGLGARAAADRRLAVGGEVVRVDLVPGSRGGGHLRLWRLPRRNRPWADCRLPTRQVRTRRRPMCRQAMTPRPP